MNVSKRGQHALLRVHVAGERSGMIRLCDTKGVELLKVYHEVKDSLSVEELATRVCVSMGYGKLCERGIQWRRDRRIKWKYR